MIECAYTSHHYRYSSRVYLELVNLFALPLLLTLLPSLILLIVLGLVEANTNSSHQSQINTRRNSNKVLNSQSCPSFTLPKEADIERDVPSWNPKTFPLPQILVE
jgi:hypothetical protein